MTIPSTVTGKVSYFGDGTTKAFPVPFIYFANTEGTAYLSVIKSDTAGQNETTLTQGTDFTITEAGQPSGTLTLETALTSEEKLTITYNIPYGQEIDYEEFGRLPSESIEKALDTLAMRDIQMREILERCVKVGVSSTTDPNEVTAQVARIHDSIDNVDAVAGNAVNINAVNANKTNINAVASNATNINNVAGNKANINTVVANLADIQATVANLAAILDAPEQAANAANSATGAASSAASAAQSEAAAAQSAQTATEKAAEAEYWAGQATTGQVQADWTQTDSAKKDFIKNKPTKVSQFENDAAYINKDVNNLTNYTKTTDINAALANKADKSEISSYRPNLFKPEWDDKLRNDIQWLRGDTFSWQDGTVYTSAYNKLLEEYNDDPVVQYYAWYNINFGDAVYTTTLTPTTTDTLYRLSEGVMTVDSTISIISKSDGTYLNVTDESQSSYSLSRTTSSDVSIADPVIETENGITYKRTTNGYKIALPDQEDAILTAYNTMGVAWFYILDTTNTRFKLPRTKFGFTGLRTSVGNMVEAGLPDHEHITSYNRVTFTGNTYGMDNPVDYTPSATFANTKTSLASLSNPIYGNSATVQPPATEMYLYFYVGNYTQPAIEQTAGLNAELFNNKADINLNNVNPSQSFKDYITDLVQPNYEAGIDISSAVGSSNKFEAPCNGIVLFSLSSPSNGSRSAYLNDKEIVHVYGSSSTILTQYTINISKGESFYVNEIGPTYALVNKFFPLKGANNV